MPAGRPFRGVTPPGNAPTVGGTLKGYKRCTLTYYDPGLGGINSSNGVADPHAKTASGEAYDATKYTCAAPPEFPFGTYLRIYAGQKNCQVKVNDRGGAIQTVNGTPHFDLSVAAYNALDKPSEGMYAIAKVKYAGPGGGPNVGLNIPNLITSPFADIAKVLGFIFSLQFLYVVGGGILLIVGLVMLLRTTSAGKAVTDIPGKAIP